MEHNVQGHSKSSFWHSHSGPEQGQAPSSVLQLPLVDSLLTAQQWEDTPGNPIPVRAAGWGEWARKGGHAPLHREASFKHSWFRTVSRALTQEGHPLSGL